ncbi:LOW QUALITY PROTEIN: leucine-rich repeat-containing protein 9 [Alca torda]
MDRKRIIVAFHFQYTCNGLSYENIDQEGLKTTALEVFFSGYPRIVNMKYFPNITTVILIGQSIENISHLGYFLLKELWIAECSLVKIDGLQKCVNLQKFCLYCNISRTENWEALAKLNVHLNNNVIKNIEDWDMSQYTIEEYVQLLRAELSLWPSNSAFSVDNQEFEYIKIIFCLDLFRSRNPETENSVHDNEDTEKTCLEKAFLQKKINAVEERINILNRKLNEILKDFQVEMKKSFNLVVQSLLMELKTVGNIHFEEGLSNNPCHWHCEWLVFDHELVLPEYIAEFEYLTLLKDKCLFPTCNIIVEGKESTERFILSYDLQHGDEVLNMEPTVKVRPQIACLNAKKQIFSVAKANISQPNRDYSGVSHSRVITFEGIRDLSKLQFFNLSWNQLKRSREDINILHKHIPNLLSLDMHPWHKVFIRLSWFSLRQQQRTKRPLFRRATAVRENRKKKLGISKLTKHSRHSANNNHLISLKRRVFETHYISIENNRITSLVGLKKTYSFIEVLCLNYNHIESIRPGQKLPNQLEETQYIRGFFVCFAHVWDAEFGENLPLTMQSLEDFHLAYNGITNMAQLLSRLKNWKFLVLQGNYISQIEGLKGFCSLQFLQELVLDRNHIKMISQGFIARQNSLLTLHLEQNQIRELNSLQPLVKLQKLFLDFNRIQESSELENLQFIPRVKVISKHGNPASIFVCIVK